jgi:hypothetical protein
MDHDLMIELIDRELQHLGAGPVEFTGLSSECDNVLFADEFISACGLCRTVKLHPEHIDVEPVDENSVAGRAALATFG